MGHSVSYDHALRHAKDRATSALLRVDSKDPAREDLAIALDDLNRAWDALTDCLVRQRSERDAQILRLIDQLAEARKK